MVDSEMRHGRKSASRHFDGYKVHTSESLESEVITRVMVTAGNAYDGEHAADLLEAVKRQLGRLPAVLLGDSHYGSCDVRVALEALTEEEDQSWRLWPNSRRRRRASRSRKTISRSTFRRDASPIQGGQTTTHTRQRRDVKDREVPIYQFDGQTCSSCALRDQCTSSKRGRTITLHCHEGLRQCVQAYNEADALRYRRRALVERKLSELLWLRGLRQSRYLGRKKTELQAVWTATVVNIKRTGAALLAYLAGEPAPRACAT